MIRLESGAVKYTQGHVAAHLGPNVVGSGPLEARLVAGTMAGVARYVLVVGVLLLIVMYVSLARPLFLLVMLVLTYFCTHIYITIEKRTNDSSAWAPNNSCHP